MQAPLLATLWAACVVWVVRLFAIFTGAWLGAFMGGSSVDHRRRMWQAMITQVSCLLLCALQQGSARQQLLGGHSFVQAWVETFKGAAARLTGDDSGRA